MTAFRFRVKFEPDPTSLWRDIVIGEERTLAEFQSALNSAIGLDQDHLWFFGTDQDYWNSDVFYKLSAEIKRSSVGLIRQDEEHAADETTIAELTRQLELGERDRFCYLFDYGDEWRFYAILKEIDQNRPSDAMPEVVKHKGDPVDQYGPPRERF